MFPFPFSFIVGVPDIPVDRIANAQAMSFNGTDQYVKADTISSLNSATQATISFWVKRVSGQPFYVGDWVGVNNSFHIEYTGGVIYFVPRNGNGNFNINYTQTFDTNWHHYAGVYDGSNVSNCKLYVDGVDVGTNSGSLNSSLSSVIGNNFTIGAMGSPTYYGESSIDEVAIFNTALSADKIQQIYDATAVVGGVPQTANLFTGGLSSSLVYWNRMGDS